MSGIYSAVRDHPCCVVLLRVLIMIIKHDFAAITMRENAIDFATWAPVQYFLA